MAERFDTGAFIRSLRGELSQAQFAEQMGVGRTTVIRYESNERGPDPEFLLKLNVLYGVDPLHVLTGRRPNHVTLAPLEMRLLTAYRKCSEPDKSVALDLVERFAMTATGRTQPAEGAVDRVRIHNSGHGNVLIAGPSSGPVYGGAHMGAPPSQRKRGK